MPPPVMPWISVRAPRASSSARLRARSCGAGPPPRRAGAGPASRATKPAMVRATCRLVADVCVGQGPGAAPEEVKTVLCPRRNTAWASVCSAFRSLGLADVEHDQRRRDWAKNPVRSRILARIGEGVGAGAFDEGHLELRRSRGRRSSPCLPAIRGCTRRPPFAITALDAVKPLSIRMGGHASRPSAAPRRSRPNAAPRSSPRGGRRAAALGECRFARSRHSSRSLPQPFLRNKGRRAVVPGRANARWRHRPCTASAPWRWLVAKERRLRRRPDRRNRQGHRRPAGTCSSGS